MSNRQKHRGWSLVKINGRITELWMSTHGEVMVIGVPVSDDEKHNCDANGCGQDHVLWRGRKP